MYCVYVITMYDDGMRRVSASCENGHDTDDESDAVLDSRPMGLQVGLSDLQSRLHRFLTRAQTEDRNGTAMRISKMMVEGQRARGVQRGQSKCSAHRGGGGDRQGNLSPMQPWEPSKRGMAGPNRHLSCELETPSPTFLGTDGPQTNQSTLSPCLTMRPQKISLAGTGAVAPGSRSSPPHPDASNLIWHWHCRLGPDGGDGLNATTTTPTFLCNAHATAGVDVAHPPSRP